MSNEAGLNEKERAILAGLAAKATADDPGLAAALQGTRNLRRVPQMPTLPPLARHWAFGAVLVAVGLTLMVVSLSTSLALGVFGTVVVFAGMAAAVSDYARRVSARRSSTDDPEPAARG